MAVAEAIYHANRQDWRRGVEEWVDRFKEAMGQYRYDECRALVGVGDEPEYGTNTATHGPGAARSAPPSGGALRAGRVSVAIGEFATVLARHGEAEAAFGEAIAALGEALRDDGDGAALRSPAVTRRHFGGLLARQARHAEAETASRQSIDAHDRALGLTPDDPEIITSQGNVLTMTTGDRALALAPDDVDALWERGETLESLGVLLLDGGAPERYDAGCRFLVSARDSLDRAARIAPDCPGIREGLARVGRRSAEAGCDDAGPEAP